MNLCETDLAWAAGIIDAEGSISIVKNHTSYRLIICVQMTHKETILKLREIFKVGDITAQVTSNPKWQDSYSWRASGLGVVFIIKHSIGYIFTKKTQALLALEYGETCLHTRNGSCVPENVKIMREVLADEMAILNMKGKQV